MKKISSLLLAAAFSVVAASAQTTKDWYLIGGNISDIGVNFQKNNTAFSFSLTPKVAWFIKDNFALGAQALIGVNTSTGFTSFSYGLGPVARYYFADKGLKNIRKTRWFVDANVGFNGTNTKVSGSPSVNTNGLGLGIGPGIAYFVNQNIALEVLPKYNLVAGFGNAPTNNAINVSIGFQIYLPKAKLRSMKNDVK